MADNQTLSTVRLLSLCDLCFALLNAASPLIHLIMRGLEDFVMMGTQTAPAQLFYDFDLERHVPSGHMLREIDRFLDVDEMREAVRVPSAQDNR